MPALSVSQVEELVERRGGACVTDEEGVTHWRSTRAVLSPESRRGVIKNLASGYDATYGTYWTSVCSEDGRTNIGGRARPLIGKEAVTCLMCLMRS